MGLNDVWKFRMGGTIWKCPKGDDLIGHWIVNTDVNEANKPKRRNCKLCAENGKKDAKTLFQCGKCNVPLHALCFKESNTYIEVHKIFWAYGPLFRAPM